MMKFFSELFKIFTLGLFSLSLSAAAEEPPMLNYIVVLNQNIELPEEIAADIAMHTDGRVVYIYNKALQGFTIQVAERALTAITQDPRVAYVERDIPISAIGQQIPTGVRRIHPNLIALDIDGVDDYRVDVDVAVLDTGIDRQHRDLNVVGGANCLQSNGASPSQRGYYCDDSQDGDDDHYHGTHVAGSIAALDNGIGVVGVAPGARLWAVKVLDAQGSGTLSGIIAGIDWVVAQGNIEVINMSLGGSGTSSAMNSAIKSAFDSGVSVVVAAGNSNDDAKNYTPANAPKAITVSALADFDGKAGGLGLLTCRRDQDDTLANFSNQGATVDITAPGVCILSTYPIEKGEYDTISGTSMASPHVAGAAALLASQGFDPQSTWDTLISTGNYDWVDDSGDNEKEPLLDINNTAVYTPVLIATDTNTPPTAKFAYTCVDVNCEFDGSSSTDSDGSTVSYHWEFGNGEMAKGKVVIYRYPHEGAYTVTLTVTDDDNDTGMYIQELTL
jgi:subtilisin